MAVFPAVAPAAVDEVGLHRFRATITVDQHWSWQATLASPVVCEPTFRWLYRGSAQDSRLHFTARNIPLVIGFSNGEHHSNAFSVTGTAEASPSYTSEPSGTSEDPGCPSTSTPSPPPTSGCGTHALTRRRVTVLVLVGPEGGARRLDISAAFGRPDMGGPLGPACQEAAPLSGSVRGLSRQRHVERLILNRRVHRATFTFNGGGTLSRAADDFLALDGDVLAGTGTWHGTWTVRLRRVR